MSFRDWLFGKPSPLVRDGAGRYVSPAGRAYRVVVEPMAGSESAVQVTLHGEPEVPSSHVASLCVFAGATPKAVDDALRFLLRRADEIEVRFAAVREAFPNDGQRPAAAEPEAPAVEELVDPEVLEKMRADEGQ